ncbi:MAG: amino acid permease [Spirochaetota bacterium]
MNPFRGLLELARRRSSRDERSSDSHRVTAEFASEHGGDTSARVRTLGTFGGVFTPSFLTIIGVIMYLRFSWVVANAGLVQTLLIVVLASSITAITALSVASIGSNERMETGGAYFMVSRVLGFQAGGSIGIPLYLSQALSIALYVLGFAEALTALVPGWSARLVALVTMVVLAGLGLVGAGAMVRMQYAILAAIVASLVSIGAGFEPRVAVLGPGYLDGLSFWAVFAVFFPAVTGILAGVSMSGDLRDPAKSIPRGTLLAVAAGFVVYVLVPVMLAFTVPRDELYLSTALRDASRWPLLVTIGVMGATLSSAIGSLLAAPRTLQALASDRIAPALLASGVGPTKEPALALLFSMGVATLAILAGNLNAVAEVLTMFFLTTYGVLNLSAGMEYVVGNPSFRPSIRVPGWVSLLGAAGCFAVMILISPVSSAIAVAAIVAVFIALAFRRRALGGAVSGGVWEGFWTERLLSISHRLGRDEERSGKNWRPIVQLFAGDPLAHRELMSTAAMLAQKGGALAIYAMVDRRKQTDPARREDFEESLRRTARELPLEKATAQLVETAGFHEGVLVAAQAAAFAGRSYNTVMLGLPRESRRDAEYARMLVTLSRYRRNVVLFRRGDSPWLERPGPIVVWWGGRQNNARLMIILAHLLDLARGRRMGIRVATIVRDEAQRNEAAARLGEIVRDLRLEAKVAVIANPTGAPIAEVLAAGSQDAALVVLGIASMAEDALERGTLAGYLAGLRSTTAGLGAVLLVQCNEPGIEYV